MKKIAIAAAVMLLGSSGAWALGTDADTEITNNASLSYSVGTTTQTTTSADDTFHVDKKIDMILTTDENSHLVVEPGDNDQIRTFTFKNEGNADQYFKFTATNLDNPAKPDYAAPNDKADTDDNVADIEIRCQKADDSWEGWSTSIIVLVEEDDVVDCEIRADIPDTVTDDNAVMNVELVATAVTDNTGNTDESESAADSANANTVDVVLADGFDDGTLGDGSTSNGVGDSARDGKETARAGYIIQRPVLSVVKTSCVISDPLNGTVDATHHPKRIPGAVIRYMIDIKNTGSGDATGITITDNIQDTAALDYSSISTVNNVHSSKGDAACDCVSESGGTESDVDHTGAASPEVKFEDINVTAPTAPATENHTCVSFDITFQ
jgi:uncharacterized repeat protein (TIGR01451 family)